MQEYHIEQTAFFAKQVKKLTKRYPKIGKDIDHFLDGIQNIDHLGIALGDNLYKTRIRNSSAQKGKSGGFRLFTLVNYNTKQIVLVYIYSKSDLGNITEQELDEIINHTASDYI
ncbi:MAG: type II toxin-antitoxin system RelE/ParE family toxin [Bacteroidota bacterium]